MNLDNLANVGELIAGIATVLTLVFVAFELRANRRQNNLVMLTALDKGWNDIEGKREGKRGRTYFSVKPRIGCRFELYIRGHSPNRGK